MADAAAAVLSAAFFLPDFSFFIPVVVEAGEVVADGVATVAAASPVPLPLPPCEMSTQLPNFPAVVNETRQEAPSLPPVHFVFSGNVPEICTVPVDCGASTPFFVIVTDPPSKDFPVAVVSMDDDVISVEPSCPLYA